MFNTLIVCIIGNMIGYFLAIFCVGFYNSYIEHQKDNKVKKLEPTIEFLEKVLKAQEEELVQRGKIIEILNQELSKTQIEKKINEQ